MQKYLLSLTLFSIQLLVSSESPTTQNISIVWYSPVHAGHHWKEIIAKLNNGDTLTYTVFPQWKSAACIHAKFFDANHEIRDTASPYWESQMKALYEEQQSKRNKLSSC